MGDEYQFPGLPVEHISHVNVTFAEQQWKEFFDGEFFLSLPEISRNTITLADKTIVILFIEYFNTFQTQTSKCTTLFHSQTYYKCSDCQILSNSCLCEDCFDIEKHQGHHYYKEKGSGTCDCGFSQNWKKQTFCEVHKQTHKTIKKLEKKERNKFEIFFRGCFELFIQFLLLSTCKIKKSKKVALAYEEVLFSELKRLVKKSECYIQMASRILLSEYFCPILNTEQTYLYFLLSEKISESTIMIETFYEMVGNKILTKKIYETIFTSQLTFQKLTHVKITQFFDFMENQTSLINELAEKGIVFKNYEQNKEYQGINKIYLPILETENKYSKQSKSIFQPVWKALWNEGILQNQIYKTNNFFLVLKDAQEDYQIFQGLLIILLQNSVNQLKKQINEKKAMRFIIDLVKCFTILRPIQKKVENQDEIFGKILFIYLKYCTYHPENMNEVALKWLVEQISEDQAKNNIEKAWKQGIFLVEHLVTFTAFILRNYIGNALNFEALMVPYLRTEDQISQSNKRRQRLFRQFLCMKQSLGLSTVSQMKDDGLINFPQASSILTSYTIYNEEDRRFVYNGARQNCNNGFLLKNIFNLQELPEIKYRGNEIKNVEHLKQFFKRLFNDEFNTAYLKLKMENLETMERICLHDLNHIKNRFGYVMVLNLVVIDQVIEGQSEAIQKKLQEFQNFEQEKKFFNSIEGMEIPYMFTGILQAGQKEERNLNEDQEKNRKKKIQKFKQKKKNILMTMDLSIEQKEIQCIVCKEIGQRNNELFYLGYIEKNDFVENFLSKRIVGNIFMNTCLHAIHRKCFLTLIKNGKGSGYCPLCSKAVNFVFPLERQIARDNVFIRNRLIQIFTNEYEDYDVDDLQNLIFKSLLLRNSVFSVIKFKLLSNNRKAENYFETYLQILYLRSNTEEKQKMIKNIQAIYQQNQSKEDCPVKKIQTLLIEFLKKKISSSQRYIFEKEEILQLSEKMKKRQFQNFIENLEKLYEENIPIPSLENDEKNKQNEENILFSDPPSSASSLIKLRKLCKKKHINDRYCLLCSNTFCFDCEGKKHVNDNHKNIHFHINLNNGQLSVMSIIGSYKYRIYQNKFHEEWEQTKRPEDYLLNERLFQEAIEVFLLRKGSKGKDE